MEHKKEFLGKNQIIKSEEDKITERILRAAEREESEKAVELLEEAFNMPEEECKRKRDEAMKKLGLEPKDFKEPKNLEN